MTALKATKPENKEKRLKMLVFGPPGVGKTTATLQFPSSYIIDTEHGTDFYAETINKAGSVVLNTLDVDDIKDELRALLTEKHAYKTLIIDPITQVYSFTQEKWTKIFEKYAKNDKEAEVGDFGMRYWSKVKSDFKSMQRLMLALDMNVIVTSHQKDVYGTGFSKIGVTFDSMKGDDYLFDLVFRVERRGGSLIAFKIKERSEIGKAKFPDEFEWSYSNFVNYYGKEIVEREAKPIIFANSAQIVQLKDLIEALNISQDQQDKVLKQFDADKFEDLTEDQCQKVIDSLQKKIKALAKEKK